MSRGTSFVAMKAAIEVNERLTRAQGRSLLVYAEKQSERAEKQATTISRLKNRIEGLETDLEIVHADEARIVTDWNELCQMLDRVLGVRMYANMQSADKEFLWAVNYRGKTSQGHRSVAAAYQVVLDELLAVTQEEASEQQ